MEEKQTSGPFPHTRWSLVQRAGGECVERRRESLAALLHRYLPALRAHLKFEKRLPSSRVEDLLQGFVADKIVEQNLLAQADPGRGRFRSFLLVALNRYVIDQFRHDRSERKLEAQDNGQHAHNEASFDPDPSEQFDIVWARELVAEALGQMKRECQQQGRGELWEIFHCRVVEPAFDGCQPMSYEQLVERFGLETPAQAYNLLTTAKRMFARMLRQAAAEYVGEEKLVEEEIADLQSIVSRARA